MVLNKPTIVGKIVADRVVNKSIMKSMLQWARNIEMGMIISDMDKDTFLYKIWVQVPMCEISTLLMVADVLNLKKHLEIQNYYDPTEKGRHLRVEI